MNRAIACLLSALFCAGHVHAEYLLTPASGMVASGGLLEVTLFVPNDSVDQELTVDLPARLTPRDSSPHFPPTNPIIFPRDRADRAMQNSRSA